MALSGSPLDLGQNQPTSPHPQMKNKMKSQKQQPPSHSLSSSRGSVRCDKSSRAYKGPTTNYYPCLVDRRLSHSWAETRSCTALSYPPCSAQSKGHPDTCQHLLSLSHYLARGGPGPHLGSTPVAKTPNKNQRLQPYIHKTPDS